MDYMLNPMICIDLVQQGGDATSCRGVPYAAGRSVLRLLFTRLNLRGVRRRRRTNDDLVGRRWAW